MQSGHIYLQYLQYLVLYDVLIQYLQYLVQYCTMYLHFVFVSPPGEFEGRGPSSRRQARGCGVPSDLRRCLRHVHRLAVAASAFAVALERGMNECLGPGGRWARVIFP